MNGSELRSLLKNVSYLIIIIETRNFTKHGYYTQMT